MEIEGEKKAERGFVPSFFFTLTGAVGAGVFPRGI